MTENNAQHDIEVLQAELQTKEDALAKMAEQVNELTNTVSALQLKVDAHRIGMENAQEELVAFKKKVKIVALDLADEHGWCSVVEEALNNDLGIETSSRVSFTMSLTVRASGAKTDEGRPSSDWVRESINISQVEAALDDAILLDGDWKIQPSITLENIEVTDVSYMYRND